MIYVVKIKKKKVTLILHGEPQNRFLHVLLKGDKVPVFAQYAHTTRQLLMDVQKEKSKVYPEGLNSRKRSWLSEQAYSPSTLQKK